MGGVSAAGFRPGFGRGGITHSLFVNIEGVWSESGIDMRGLLTDEDLTGARACGDVWDTGDGVSEVDMLNIEVNP